MNHHIRVFTSCFQLRLVLPSLQTRDSRLKLYRTPAFFELGSFYQSRFSRKRRCRCGWRMLCMWFEALTRLWNEKDISVVFHCKRLKQVRWASFYPLNVITTRGHWKDTLCNDPHQMISRLNSLRSNFFVLLLTRPWLTFLTHNRTCDSVTRKCCPDLLKNVEWMEWRPKVKFPPPNQRWQHRIGWGNVVFSRWKGMVVWMDTFATQGMSSKDRHM